MLIHQRVEMARRENRYSLHILSFSVTISTDFRANLAISGNWVIFSHQYSFRSNPEKHTHSDISYLCYPVQHLKNIDLIWVKYCLCDFFTYLFCIKKNMFALLSYLQGILPFMNILDICNFLAIWKHSSNYLMLLSHTSI